MPQQATQARRSPGAMKLAVLVLGVTILGIVLLQFERLQLRQVMTTSFFLSEPLVQSTVGHDICPTTDSERKFFDPFQDISFEPVQAQPPQDSLYSRVDCVGAGTRTKGHQSDAQTYNDRRPNFTSRSCRYRNIYYRVSDQSFHYFASPIEERARNAAWQNGNKPGEEFLSRREVSVGNIFDSLERSQFDMFKIEPWMPQFHHDETPPIDNIVQAGPSNLKFLLYRPSHSMNFGHLLWDDMMSLYSLLHLFGYERDAWHGESIQLVPLLVELPDRRQNYGGHDPLYRCTPRNNKKWTKCVKMYRKFYHEFLGVMADPCTGDILRTGNWLLGERNIGVWGNMHREEACALAPTRTNQPPPKADYILLPEVLAGTGRLSFYACEIDCSVGRGPQWQDFRNFLLRKVFGPHRGCTLSQEAPKGYITFSLPGGSSRPNKAAWFEKEIKLAKQKYGEDVVRVVDMAKLSIQEQAMLAHDSAVLVQNVGGGGATAIFLSNGASVLLYCHDSVRMDQMFYESAGYLRPTWISPKEQRHVNRTMAILESEVEKTSTIWPNIIAARGLDKGRL